jgi:hypothetical protein
MTQLGLRDHDAGHSTVPQLDSLQLCLVQQRARQLAVDRQHVDERETTKLRTGQHDPMQLAAREANPIRNLTSKVGVEDLFVFPYVVRGNTRVLADGRLRWRLGRERRELGRRFAPWHGRVVLELGVAPAQPRA